MEKPKPIFLQQLGFFAIAALALGLAACGGSDGSPGADAPPLGVDINNATTINAAITSVTTVSPLVIEFSLTDENGNAVRNLPASNIDFSFAKLVPGTDGNASRWQNYINVTMSPCHQPRAAPVPQTRYWAIPKTAQPVRL